MFLKPLKAQTMWKTLEIIIAKRMQNMGQIENKNFIFVAKVHFDILNFNLRINPDSFGIIISGALASGTQFIFIVQ